MMKSIRRVAVLSNHLKKNIGGKTCSSAAGNDTETLRVPSMTISPSLCLVDEKINIRLTGLCSKELVTLVADVIENGKIFESRCLYQADDNGEISNCTNHSLSGSFKGVEQMGLFWSIAAPDSARTRLIKKDVATPMEFKIQAFTGDQTTVPDITHSPFAEAVVQRQFMKPGVRRIPLTSGKVRGTIFVPEGDGPFPGLVDMFGGLVTLIETRAALLASHGYATIALSYLYADGLPNMLLDADLNYIQESYEWFSEQEYIDKGKLGAIGICFGGFLSLCLTSFLPQIKAVVNVNGICMAPENAHFTGSGIDKEKWLGTAMPDKVYNTPEGVVINRVYDSDNPVVIPAWQHGAKILVIYGEDDKQVHPKWHRYYYENCPPEYKTNIEMYQYHGAGHLIEPPYMPHIRSVEPGRKRMLTINFIPEEFKDEPMMTGGFPKEHAHAQEDSWQKTLQFLHRNLQS